MSVKGFQYSILEVVLNKRSCFRIFITWMLQIRKRKKWRKPQWNTKTALAYYESTAPVLLFLRIFNFPSLFYIKQENQKQNINNKSNSKSNNNAKISYSFLKSLVVPFPKVWEFKTWINLGDLFRNIQRL